MFDETNFAFYGVGRMVDDRDFKDLTEDKCLYTTPDRTMALKIAAILNSTGAAYSTGNLHWGNHSIGRTYGVKRFESAVLRYWTGEYDLEPGWIYEMTVSKNKKGILSARVSSRSPAIVNRTTYFRATLAKGIVREADTKSGESYKVMVFIDIQKDDDPYDFATFEKRARDISKFMVRAHIAPKETLFEMLGDMMNCCCCPGEEADKNK